MKPHALVLLLAVLVMGCGGGHSPQEAEDWVRAEWERTVEEDGLDPALVERANVFCDEISGERYRCALTVPAGGEDIHNEFVVDAEDLE